MDERPGSSEARWARLDRGYSGTCRRRRGIAVVFGFHLTAARVPSLALVLFARGLTCCGRCRRFAARRPAAPCEHSGDHSGARQAPQQKLLVFHGGLHSTSHSRATGFGATSASDRSGHAPSERVRARPCCAVSRRGGASMDLHRRLSQRANGQDEQGSGDSDARQAHHASISTRRATSPRAASCRKRGGCDRIGYRLEEC
jgi:hypothetical protein